MSTFSASVFSAPTVACASPNDAPGAVVEIRMRERYGPKAIKALRAEFPWARITEHPSEMGSSYSIIIKGVAVADIKHRLSYTLPPSASRYLVFLNHTPPSFKSSTRRSRRGVACGNDNPYAGAVITVRVLNGSMAKRVAQRIKNSLPQASVKVNADSMGSGPSVTVRGAAFMDVKEQAIGAVSMNERRYVLVRNNTPPGFKASTRRSRRGVACASTSYEGDARQAIKDLASVYKRLDRASSLAAEVGERSGERAIDAAQTYIAKAIGELNNSLR